MTVKQAIEILSTMNPDAILLVAEFDGMTDTGYPVKSVYSKDEFQGVTTIDDSSEYVVLK